MGKHSQAVNEENQRRLWESSESILENSPDLWLQFGEHQGLEPKYTLYPSAIGIQDPIFGLVIFNDKELRLRVCFALKANVKGCF